MTEPRKTLESDEIDRQLAELDANPEAAVDTTVRQLHAKLETLATQLKQPLPPDPCTEEAACRQVIESAKALVFEQTQTFAPAPSAASAAEAIPESLDHFRIVKLLGQGGMGAVYLAQDTRLGREVALKTMRPELAAKPQAKERFLREARAAAAIEHDHIVPIYHVGEANGTPYLAMPFLKGQSLDDVLKAKKTLPPGNVIRLGIQVARGLAEAHDHGLIHRDIKPANLWVDPKGRVKILDFGLARTSDDEVGLTQSGTILGTPSYMAPEQARALKVDGRADLYSLGVVLYRAVTGRLPLHGPDTMSMLMALATETPRPASEINPAIPPELSAFIMRLLAKERDDRPASAHEVIQTLQRLLQPQPAPVATAVPTSTVEPLPNNPWSELDVPASETPTLSEPAQPRTQGQKRKLRRGPLIAAGLLGLALLVTFGVIVIIRDKDGKKVAEIEVPPGGKVEIIDNTPKPIKPVGGPPQAVADPERQAAEYVLSIGGVVRVNGEDLDIKAVGDLPKQSFTLTGINLNSNKRVTVAGLAHFKDCKNLTSLGLSITPVTDAGLAHLKDFKKMAHLHLANTQVTDAGLAHLKECKNLTYLDVRNSKVTAKGLEEFHAAVPRCKIEHDGGVIEPKK